MAENPLKVLVTPRSLSRAGHPALERLRGAGMDILMPWPGRQPETSELEKVLPDCDAYLAGVERISGDLLSRCPRLRVISRNGVGLDNVDMEAARASGIIVRGTPGANSQGVAELALTLMLSGLRSIAFSSSVLKSGGWERRIGAEVAGKTLGIVGCGQIGRRLASMAAGLDMKILAYDAYPTDQLRKSEIIELVSLDLLLETSDVISLHCPPGDSPLIDAGVLGRLKTGVCLVNTARAGLVDHDALAAGIGEGTVGHYATDVYEHEPPEMLSFFESESVTLTPHIGGFTKESVARATVAAVENIMQVMGDEADRG